MPLPHDYRDPAYLRAGTPAQRVASTTLDQLKVWTLLSTHTPVLAGTVPLDLHVNGSDLDIICWADDLEAFRGTLDRCYGAMPGYTARLREMADGPAVVASFQTAAFPVEVFGQRLAVPRQRAYRHLIVEARVLHVGGSATRAALRGLRGQGLKTEPAFARLLGLPGDPYLALLGLEDLDDLALAELVRRRRRP